MFKKIPIMRLMSDRFVSEKNIVTKDAIKKIIIIPVRDMFKTSSASLSLFLLISLVTSCPIAARIPIFNNGPNLKISAQAAVTPRATGPRTLADIKPVINVNTILMISDKIKLDVSLKNLYFKTLFRNTYIASSKA